MSAVVNPFSSLLARMRAANRPATAQGADVARAAQPASSLHSVATNPAALRIDRSRARWLALSQDLEAHARNGNWRSYRNTRLRMAQFLRELDHPAQALELYLDVWYLDLNGPRDAQDSRRAGHGARLLNEDPLFEPGRSAVPAGVPREVRRLTATLALRAVNVQTIFLHVAGLTHRNHALPLLPTSAWLLVGTELLR